MRKLLLNTVLVMSLLQTGCLTTRSQMKEQTQLQTQVETLQQTKAESVARSDEFDEQLRSYNGRIEVLENDSREFRDRNAKKDEQLKLEKELLENKFKLVQEALLKVESELQNMSNEIEALKKSRVKASPSKAQAKKGNYSQAEVDFSKKKWKQAAVGYQKYRDLNPKGKRYSDSTYKIGVCFQEMGLKSEAKAFYEEVIEKFPKSRMADKSRYRIKNLK